MVHFFGFDARPDPVKNHGDLGLSFLINTAIVLLDFIHTLC